MLYLIMSNEPLLQKRLGRIFDQDVHMINASHALQTHPILEPHDSIPCLFNADASFLLQALNEVLLDELLNQLPRLGRDIASLSIDGNWSSSPHENMLDPLLKAVRPIVQQDGIVSAILEWDWRVVRERVSVDWLVVFRSPTKSLLNDEVCDAAICLLRGEGPAQVLVKIGWQALELL